MNHARRTDTTHAPIRNGLRRVYGIDSVIDTHELGQGFPDLVLGVAGLTVLMEVKTNLNRRRGVRLRHSPLQEAVRFLWHGGPWLIVHSLDDAIAQLQRVLAEARRA
jgi:hypothetical protein